MSRDEMIHHSVGVKLKIRSTLVNLFRVSFSNLQLCDNMVWGGGGGGGGGGAVYGLSE